MTNAVRVLGLPTIQGALLLFDATNGAILAIMDSASITTLRTAATTAVAAKHLARAGARTAAFVGCGVQARAHVAALLTVRPVARALVFDADPAVAARFAGETAAAHGITVDVARDLAAATLASEIVITCTPTRAGVPRRTSRAHRHVRRRRWRRWRGQ